MKNLLNKVSKHFLIQEPERLLTYVFAGKPYTYKSLRLPECLTPQDEARLAEIGIFLDKKERRVSGLVHLRDKQKKPLDLPYLFSVLSGNLKTLLENPKFYYLLSKYVDHLPGLREYPEKFRVKQLAEHIQKNKLIYHCITELAIPGITEQVENPEVFLETTSQSIAKYTILEAKNNVLL